MLSVEGADLSSLATSEHTAYYESEAGATLRPVQRR